MEKRNGIGTALSITGWLAICIGIIAFLGLLASKSVIAALVTLVSSIISGLVIAGFGEAIALLQKIASNTASPTKDARATTSVTNDISAITDLPVV